MPDADCSEGKMNLEPASFLLRGIKKAPPSTPAKLLTNREGRKGRGVGALSLEIKVCIFPELSPSLSSTFHVPFSGLDRAKVIQQSSQTFGCISVNLLQSGVGLN